MKWSDAVDWAAKNAPAIGGMIGGPAGAIVGLGAKLAIQEITGTSDPDQAVQILSANRDKLIELQQRLAEIESDALKAQLADTQNARSTMLGLAQLGSAIAWGPVVVSTIVLIGFFVTAIYLIRAVQDSRVEVANVLTQIVFGEVPLVTLVVQFWLGSSRSSQNKDIALANSIPIAALAQMPFRSAAPISVTREPLS